MQLQGNTWFVKSDGKIRGPFDANVIRSMKERGRVARRSELSRDRSSWVEAAQFEELFVEEDIPIEDAIPQNGQTASIQYFYNNAGVETGPITFEKLQQLASDGTLKQNDLIWYEGASDWFPANSLSELKFRTDAKTVSLWFSNNRVMACLLAASILLVLIIPVWYVINKNTTRTRDIAEERQRQMDFRFFVIKEQNELQLEMKKLEIEEKEMLARAADSEIARKRHVENLDEQRKKRAQMAENAAILSNIEHEMTKLNRKFD